MVPEIDANAAVLAAAEFAVVFGLDRVVGGVCCATIRDKDRKNNFALIWITYGSESPRVTAGKCLDHLEEKEFNAGVSLNGLNLWNKRKIALLS
jgi:hypothetical protein